MYIASEVYVLIIYFNLRISNLSQPCIIIVYLSKMPGKYYDNLLLIIVVVIWISSFSSPPSEDERIIGISYLSSPNISFGLHLDYTAKKFVHGDKYNGNTLIFVFTIFVKFCFKFTSEKAFELTQLLKFCNDPLTLCCDNLFGRKIHEKPL